MTETAGLRLLAEDAEDLAVIAAASQGDTRSVRVLAAEVYAADRACDEAVERAGSRRDMAHHHTKRIAGSIELALTGASR